jgi:uncharacterized protein (DUF2235 family)
MAKRIVFCADGTWQLPRMNTNVNRLYKALTVGADQVTFYDDGIGASATGFDRVIEGAFGEGLTQKVRDGYTWLAHVYSEGDQIYLFGFSRGAYTVRSLAGLLKACGLPAGNPTDACIDSALAAYRDPAGRSVMLAGISACGLVQPQIRMIGVWDTVGALGIPALFGGIEGEFEFLDTSLHPEVASAYQCVALDEKRPQFPATLWTPPFASTQTVEQVWFSGCHGDVGGGTALGGPVDSASRLCDITLGWMMSKGQAQGLSFSSGFEDIMALLPQEDALDAVHETLPPGDPQHLRNVPEHAAIAESVVIRISSYATYRPGNLVYDGDELDDTYTIVPVVNTSVL